MRALCEKWPPSLVTMIVITASLGQMALGTQGPSGSAEDPGARGIVVGQDPNELRWDLADAFEFGWESIELSAKTTTGWLPVETVTVSVGFEFLDANVPDGLVTIDVDSAQVVEVLDEYGKVVDCRPIDFSEERRYQESGWFWDDDRVYAPEKMQPFDVAIKLPGGRDGHAPPFISQLTGYIYALYGDAVIGVDIPLDPDANCVEHEMAPDLRICIDLGTPPCPGPLEYVNILPPGSRGVLYRPTTSVGVYKYTTRVKSKTGQPVMGVYDVFYWRRYCPFGDYAIVRTELFDSKKGKSVTHQRQWVQSSPSGRGAHCIGEHVQSLGDSLDTVRHIIVVHPREVRIPFVLKNIRVPNLQYGDE